MKARIKLTFIFLLVYMAAVLFFWPFSEGSAVSGNKKIDKTASKTGGNYNSSEAWLRKNS